MKRILGIGNALVDVMTLINDDQMLEKFSLPKGSMILVDGQKSQQIRSETKNFKRTFASGGSAANTIHGLAMMGVETRFIGSVGSDDTGDFFEQEMKDAGVNALLFRRKSDTGTAVALISRDTERTFATHLGAAIELEADDLKPEYFDEYDILYLEGYLINNLRLVDTACRIAKDKNMAVALDMASYNVVEAYIEEFRKIVKDYVDIVFANEEEARAFTGLSPDEALSYFSELCEIAVVKIGSGGSLLKKNNKVIRMPALPVRCNDTTGAGDLYASGFLYGYANNMNLKKCGEMGSLMAGKVIEIVGARMEKKIFKEIRRIIKDSIDSNQIG